MTDTIIQDQLASLCNILDQQNDLIRERNQIALEHNHILEQILGQMKVRR